ncbi:type II secretion system protein GspD [Trinickia caryophylli]|uniref:Type II secretion system protein D (GspD) n=2 Tax=Trinickia caryophylli TaxID=28094 RepID=A0A1X7GTF7_TRICW|nr:type II secretion system protein GspD [Trinickia caryophylli]SMF73731.1 type II secretion system protein D (GspD) [Trinickia caryophylli]
MALRRIAATLLIAGMMAAQGAHAEVALNFVNADIDQVAKAIGAATGKTIIVDPRVKGQLNLVSENPVPEDQAIKTLESALRMQGFALVQDHGLLKVVPEADAKLQGVPTYVGNVTSARGDQVITQVFQLHNESANNLLPVLRPLISPNNTIAAYPANNTLVVTDYADNVRRIASIIAGVDNAAGREIEVVSLKNANAVDMAQQLSKLLDPGAIGNTDATLKVSVSADPRTNSLLLRASNKARLAVAKKLAQQLDAPSSEPGNMHVVHLRNANAVQLAKTLRGMMGKGAGEGASSAESNNANSFNQGGGAMSTGTSGVPPLPSSYGGSSLGGSGSSLLGSSGGGRGGADNNGGFLGDKQGQNNDQNQPGGMIQADAATNSLVITASDAVYRNLRAVIDQLDARRAQVYIEALVVELNSTRAGNLGIQWQIANGNLLAGTNLSSTAGNANSSNILTVAAGLAAGGATGAASLPNTLTQGLNVGWLHNMFGVQGLGGLLQYFAGVSDANVLSTPNLVTLDNEEAKIVVGQNVPIPTGSYANLSTATPGTAFNTYDRRDVGLTLHVKPQITAGGILKLQLYTEDSSVVGSTISTSANSQGPTFNIRSIQSTVLADNGEIIVLGGLMQDNYQVSNSKVPLLGDIPWIGQLFRSETKQRQKTNLMVFLRPVIINDSDTAQQITENRYNYVQDMTGGYRSDNNVMRDKDFPVVPPMPAGPSQGASPATNLFDLRQMTRQPTPQPQTQTQPQTAPSQPQAVPLQQEPPQPQAVPQQAQPATPGASQ